jgi:hypothetical protein
MSSKRKEAEKEKEENLSGYKFKSNSSVKSLGAVF